jgi:5-methyltetrahydropteroyltriglutamate--homocysteine methyltransferase
VIELLLAEQQNHGARKVELNAAVAEAVAHVVQKQIESGIVVINDGEQGRTDYTVHVLDRLAGFAGESMPPFGDRPACTGEATWKNWTAAQADIDLSKDVINGADATELFITSPSPGQISRYLKDRRDLRVRACRCVEA